MGAFGWELLDGSFWMGAFGVEDRDCGAWLGGHGLEDVDRRTWIGGHGLEDMDWTSRTDSWTHNHCSASTLGLDRASTTISHRQQRQQQHHHQRRSTNHLQPSPTLNQPPNQLTTSHRTTNQVLRSRKQGSQAGHRSRKHSKAGRSRNYSKAGGSRRARKGLTSAPASSHVRESATAWG